MWLVLNLLYGSVLVIQFVCSPKFAVFMWFYSFYLLPFGILNDDDDNNNYRKYSESANLCQGSALHADVNGYRILPVHAP